MFKMFKNTSCFSCLFYVFLPDPGDPFGSPEREQTKTCNLQSQRAAQLYRCSFCIFFWCCDFMWYQHISTRFCCWWNHFLFLLRCLLFSNGEHQVPSKMCLHHCFLRALDPSRRREGLEMIGVDGSFCRTAEKLKCKLETPGGSCALQKAVEEQIGQPARSTWTTTRRAGVGSRFAIGLGRPELLKLLSVAVSLIHHHTTLSYYIIIHCHALSYIIIHYHFITHYHTLSCIIILYRDPNLEKARKTCAFIKLGSLCWSLGDYRQVRLRSVRGPSPAAQIVNSVSIQKTSCYETGSELCHVHFLVTCGIIIKQS